VLEPIAPLSLIKEGGYFMLEAIEKYVEDPTRSFGIISAHDNTQSVSTNLDRNVHLARNAEIAGFEYVWLEGYWQGQNDSRYEESSLFVLAKPGDNQRLFNFLQKHAKAAKQDGFIFRNENDDTITLEYTNGESKRIGKYQANQMGDVYSRVAGGQHKGLPFVFASAGVLIKVLSQLTK